MNMAITPAELVATVASVLSVPVHSVRNYDRRLMEAGLRTKKGHGRGSALMGPEDAAILLAAIVASDEISRGAECVQTLYALPYRKSPGLTFFPEFNPPEILLHRKIIGADQTEPDTFGSAFVSLMRYFVANRDISNFPTVQVSIAQGRPYRAHLSIISSTEERGTSFGFGDSPDLGWPTELEGLRIQRAIGLHTLNLVADVIAGRARLGEAA